MCDQWTRSPSFSPARLKTNPCSAPSGANAPITSPPILAATWSRAGGTRSSYSAPQVSLWMATHSAYSSIVASGRIVTSPASTTGEAPLIRGALDSESGAVTGGEVGGTTRGCADMAQWWEEAGARLTVARGHKAGKPKRTNVVDQKNAGLWG